MLRKELIMADVENVIIEYMLAKDEERELVAVIQPIRRETKYRVTHYKKGWFNTETDDLEVAVMAFNR